MNKTQRLGIIRAALPYQDFQAFAKELEQQFVSKLSQKRARGTAGLQCGFAAKAMKTWRKAEALSPSPFRWPVRWPETELAVETNASFKVIAGDDAAESEVSRSKRQLHRVNAFGRSSPTTIHMETLDCS